MLSANECPELCTGGCNNNSVCDCGKQECRCKPGYGGTECATDLCAAARCSDNGTCAATYLGASSLIPVTSPGQACICDDGWSGHLCQYNPCATMNKTCSGQGTCVANGDLDAVCQCDPGYSGEDCETSCEGICQGFWPYGCNPNLPDVVLYGCNQSGGCSYKKEGEGALSSGFCVFKEVGSGNQECTCTSDNECEVVGLCDASGECPVPTQLADGTPCNSIPWGICQNGSCSAAGSSSPTATPEATPTNLPTNKPSHSCIDTTFKFKSRNPTTDKITWKDCTWAARKNSDTRCQWKAVSSMCPATCNTCSICLDSTTRFKIYRSPSSSKLLRRNCNWTAEKPRVRCKIEGMGDACRATCGKCSL